VRRRPADTRFSDSPHLRQPQLSGLRGVRAVALKLGARGARLLWHDREWAVPPYPVAPIDTTGAGDSFDAGFIYEWLRGGSPEQCLQTAAICGALSTRGMGGLEGFPAVEELNEALVEVRSA